MIGAHFVQCLQIQGPQSAVIYRAHIGCPYAVHDKADFTEVVRGTQLTNILKLCLTVLFL